MLTGRFSQICCEVALVLGSKPKPVFPSLFLPPLDKTTAAKISYSKDTKSLLQHLPGEDET